MYNKFAEFSVKDFKQPESKILIYALLCPLTLDIKYVGKTTRGFERIRQHYYDYKNKEGRTSYRKVRWVQSLREKGLIFKVCYLEYCRNEQELNIAEQKWIKLFRDLGEKLLNHTDGGEDCFRQVYTDSQKKLISERTKMAMAKPEVRENLRLTHLGKISPMRGKSRSEEFRNKVHKANLKRAKIIWTSCGEKFESILEASRNYNCPPTSIKRIINTHLNRGGVFFYDYDPSGEK